MEYPEEAGTIQAKFDDLQSCWNNLTQMVKEKNESLAETGELKRFIISLDDFVNWLQQVSETCSAEDLPQSLSEAESKLDEHFEVRVSDIVFEIKLKLVLNFRNEICLFQQIFLYSIHVQIWVELMFQ